jgi:hypothetical protein
MPKKTRARVRIVATTGRLTEVSDKNMPPTPYLKNGSDDLSHATINKIPNSKSQYPNKS